MWKDQCEVVKHHWVKFLVVALAVVVAGGLFLALLAFFSGK
jgi:hypothetical protein